MAEIVKVAIIGASGNFGTPITAALREAGFQVTIVTRAESTTPHPEDVPVIRTEYTFEKLSEVFLGQDAVVCVVGPAGIVHQATFVDAAERAEVKRFLLDDYGWGGSFRALPQFAAIHAHRVQGWDRAKAHAVTKPAFTWTGISSGNPIDWALRKFPLMGFDVSNYSATIYDQGTEQFTGTTLAGIGQAVVGVLQHPTETANQFVKVLSSQTCQNELLEAFQTASGRQWNVKHSTTQELKARGEEKFNSGISGWVLELVVAQLFDKGEARCNVAPSFSASDSGLLGVIEESPLEIARKALADSYSSRLRVR